MFDEEECRYNPMGKKGKLQSSAPAKKGKKGQKEEPETVVDSRAAKLEAKREAKEKRQQGRSMVAQSHSWTGKLPGSLLHEHCQKQKWNKVQYDMRKVQDGFIATAVLSWKNPRTQEVITVKMHPPSPPVKPQETPIEARHYAATYALHRIAFDKNIHMVLPSNHKDLWRDLEEARKELVRQNPRKASLEYTSDPFAAILEKRKENERRANEREAREAEEKKTKKPTIVIGNGTKSNPHARASKLQVLDKLTNSPLSQVMFPRKVWENAVMIDLEPRTRALIDDAIRHHSDWTETDDSASELKSIDYSELLEEIGFRKTHIDEAVQYTSSFNDSLEWLIFHVPEDDLPPVFTKNEEDSHVRLRITTDIEKERKIETLCQGSCSKNEASTALDTCDGDIVNAAVSLTNRLVNFRSTETETDPQLAWQEEQESLGAIFGDRLSCKDGGADMYEVALHPEGLVQGKKADHLLALRAYRSPNYPCDICGLQVVVKDPSYRLPKYINMSILIQMLNYITQSGFIGMPYIYACVEWLESNISRVLADPGPLYSKPVNKQNGESMSRTHSEASFNRKSIHPRSGTREKRSASIIEGMRDAYRVRQKSRKFKESVVRRTSLPAWKKMDELVKVIQSNTACLVTGETGSGKSTQIVQFILDKLCSGDDFATNIICTQPRRISAIGLAERVSSERVGKCGQEVGYIIRGENRTDKTTRISFVTTGVLLRMIQSLYSGSENNGDRGFFNNLGYIFVDEVHERSIDSDFLLIVLKQMMHKFPNLHVILMSATIELETFENFFGSSRMAHVHIEGRTFPIQDFYLDQILSKLDFTVTTARDEVIKPRADSKYFQDGNINYDLIAQIVRYVDESLDNAEGSILIFLPGVMEITRCLDAISGIPDGREKYWGLPLHSGVSSADQRRVFLSAPKGKRKIVVSTNVAETSVTIADAVAVIDTGRVKTVRYDSGTDTTRLVETWASRAEISQRRGRAGRVRAGLCYRIFTEDTEHNTMLSHPIPEIKRTPLGSVYLVVKAMGVTDVFRFLQEGLDPPHRDNVENARRTLEEVGALRSDKLTALGRYLSMLPTDIKSGKLLLYSTLFGCVESGATLASIAVTGNPFLRNRESRDKVKVIQNRFSRGKGDLMAVLNAFNAYNALTTSSQRRHFLEENLLSRTAIHDIQSTRVQYLSQLQDLGFLPMGYSKHIERFPAFNRHSENFTILIAISGAALFPNIARVQPPDPKFLASGVGSVALDPDARKIKYWIRNETYIRQRAEDRDQGSRTDRELPARRAFLHPSSTFFSFGNSSEEVTQKDIKMDADGNYIYAPCAKTGSSYSSSFSPLSSSFIAYNSSQTTSKLYLHDVTPTSVLGLLLFGGQISYDLSSVRSGRPSPGIVMDGWLPIRTWCKNAVMMTRLRRLLDRFLDKRLATPLYGEQNEEGSGDEELLNSDILKTIERVLSIERR
ncbi:DEKNAAC104750 [Brettanomyces naardenensis]|uniref:DEKNAAC104750 n=1 Tax=Brettanomyces naardenensis TaxID=13370 RepID=A0A448YR72_BRENA|nr:DEKNAAC104750 [Brettanomyces naardenensis]